VQQSLHGTGSEQIAEALHQATRLTMRHLVDRAGLTMTAVLVLGRLDREGPMRLTALAAAEGLSQPAMTQLIQRLELQGLTARVDDPHDGRASLIYLDEAGQALLTRQRQRRRDRLGQLLATLSPEDHAALSLAAYVALPILQRLIDTATNSLPSTTAAPSGTDM
jgi:DNA-binding MarR family transcriptional regulator